MPVTLNVSNAELRQDNALNDEFVVSARNDVMFLTCCDVIGWELASIIK